MGSTAGRAPSEDPVGTACSGEGAGRPLASVSLDLDNLWSYLKTHGESQWRSRPSYLDRLVPCALEALDRLGLTITFFIVGVDAVQAANGRALASIVDAGHEVGNHSFEHEPWLHLYTPDRLDREIGLAEEAIATATGSKPIGFRGPGFSWSPQLLECLERRGYQYDASTLPTYLGPLARSYYFWTAKLTAEQRAERRSLFGSFRDGLQPIDAYWWRMAGGRRLLEIPVTTVPWIKTPFHLSYLIYLSRFSELAMRTYLRIALAACRSSGTEPSFLLHPLDLLGGDQVPELSFFPGMDLSGRRKAALFASVLGALAERFSIVPMGEHARSLQARPGLRVRTPAGTG